MNRQPHQPSIAFALATLVTVSLPAPARAQHAGDILLSVENGRITTSLIAEGGLVTPGVRVFGAEFAEIEPNFTDEPGFDCEPGTFPFPSQIGFRIRRALHRWDSVGFTPIAHEALAIDFGPVVAVTTPACDTISAGFSLSVGSNGTWHRHLEYTLGEPTAPGVYLLELELFSSDPGIAASLPFWIVFLQPDPIEDLEPQHQAALEWAAERLSSRPCAADFNGGGARTTQDLFDFLAAFFSGTPGNLGGADFNGSCGVSSQDIFDFLAAWFGPCP